MEKNFMKDAKEPLVAGGGNPAGYEDVKPQIEYNEEGLSTQEAARRLAQYGPNELPETKKNPWLLLLEAFWGPMPIMIWIAIVVELIVGIVKVAQGKTGAVGPDEHFVDFVVLMILQTANAVVGWHEELKAGDAVAALKSSLAPKANVKRDGVWLTIDGRELVPGDLVVLALGGAIPADCQLLEGKPIFVDQAALTGESLPTKMVTGDIAKMGSNVTNGEIEAVVESTGAMTFFGKTAALLNSVESSSNIDKILLKILIAICSVGGPCIIIVIAVMAARGNDAEIIITTAVVLVVAIVPIANAVVCTSTLAFGSRKLSEEKAIVTRLSSIEELAGMNMLCSDKTGTLTLNKMVMQQLCTADGQAYTFPDESSKVKEAQDVLLFASLAAKWKETPKDALDTLTLNATKDRRAELDTYNQIDYEPFDPAIKRTCATLVSATGEQFKCTKGAPNIVLKMCWNYEDINGLIEPLTEDYAERGIRTIGVARTDADDKWCFTGLITFLDPPRPDTADTIANAHTLGVKVKMITGDHLAIAKETCRVLGMGTNVFGTDNLPGGSAEAMENLGVLGPLCEGADGFAGVFPEHKFMIVEILQKRGWICGMTGDGVNDAPALKVADVGIAVEGSTDAARAAADIVLTNPGLSTIVTAIHLSRKIFQRVKNYLIYRIASSFMLGMFFAISVGAAEPINVTGCNILKSFKNCYSVGEVGIPAEIAAITCTPTQMVQVLTGSTGGVCGPDNASWGMCGPGSQSLASSLYNGHNVNDVQLAFEPICHYSHSQASVVDAKEIPMTNYFVLTILQLVFMIVFNDGCMITVAWDNVKPSAKPKCWYLDRLFILTAIMAVTVTLLQVFFLFFGLAALQQPGATDKYAGVQISNINLFKNWFGIDEPLLSSQLDSMMYISLSWAGFLTLMSGRAESFFFESAPGFQLACAMSFSLIVTLLLGAFLKSTTISFQGCPWPYIGCTFLWNVFAFLVLDCIKVFTNMKIEQYFASDLDVESIKMEVHRENRKRQETFNRQRGGSRAGSRSMRDGNRSSAASRAMEISNAGGAASSSSMDPDVRLRKKVTKLTQLTARLTILSKDEDAKKILDELRALD